MDALTNLALVPMLLPAWLNPEHIIMALGNWALWGVAFIVLIECIFFPVLPGDSLLFTVGMFVALGTIGFGSLHTGTVLLVCAVVLVIAAIGGNIGGYWLGRLIGPPIFKPRPGLAGRIFNPAYVDKTHAFFDKHGNQALILARFVPVVRTFVTIIAGVGKMAFATFIRYTAIGGLAWVIIVLLLGFFLGQVSFIHNNIEVALVLIVLVSLIPMGIEWLKARGESRREAVAAA
jgi:membrane-associated protein